MECYRRNKTSACREVTAANIARLSLGKSSESTTSLGIVNDLFKSIDGEQGMIVLELNTGTCRVSYQECHCLLTGCS